MKYWVLPLSLVLLFPFTPVWGAEAPLSSESQLRSLQKFMGVPFSFDAYSMHYTALPTDPQGNVLPHTGDGYPPGSYGISVIKPGKLANLKFIDAEVALYMEVVAKQFGVKTGWKESLVQLSRSQNRMATHRLLEDTYQFLLAGWKEMGLFLEGYGEGDSYEYEQIRDGLWPAIVVTDPNDLNKVLFVIAIALDGKDGLPFTWRLVGKGISGMPDALPAKKIRVEDGETLRNLLLDPEKFLRRRVLKPYTLEESRALSILFSYLPTVTGDRGELKHYFKKPGFSEDLSALVQGVVLRHELDLWGASDIPDDVREEHQRRLTLALRAPELAEFLNDAFRGLGGAPEQEFIQYIVSGGFDSRSLFPTAQNTDLYIEANSYMRIGHQIEEKRLGRVPHEKSRARLYNMRFGIDQIEYSTPDDLHFGGPTDILKHLVREFQTRTPKVLKRSRGFKLTQKTVFLPNQAVISPDGLPCPYLIAFSQLAEQFYFLKQGTFLNANGVGDYATPI